MSFDLARTNALSAQPGDREQVEQNECRSPLKSRPARIGRLVARLLGVAMLAAAILAAPATSQARISVGIAVSFGPPALPIYYQPPCPAYGYLWTPGYWAWDPDYGYYWVPGTWVEPPFEGALWTPGYWDYDDGVYVWYGGYWGPVVGYYGGIDYGFGYTGYGYQGGYWRGDRLYYNRTVNNISTTNITNVYSRTVVNNRTEGRASFNGGPGGTTARPTSEQLAASRMRRRGPVAAQERQMQVAQSNPQQRASINHGRPAIAATDRPGAFSGGEAVQATRAGAPYKAPKGMPQASPQNRGAERSMPAGRGPEARQPERQARPTFEQPRNRGAERSLPAGRAPEARQPERQSRPTFEQPRNRGAERSMPAGRAPEASPPPRREAPRTEMPAPRRSRQVQPNVQRSPMQSAPQAQPGGMGRGRAPEAKPGRPPKPEKPHNPHDH
ncbi:MAG: hypothetical protein ACM3NO_09640 [Deltaproteobacteria bacterium]